MKRMRQVERSIGLELATSIKIANLELDSSENSGKDLRLENGGDMKEV